MEKKSIAGVYKNMGLGEFQVMGGVVKPGQTVEIKEDSHQSVKILASHKDFTEMGKVKDQVPVKLEAPVAKVEAKAEIKK